MRNLRIAAALAMIGLVERAGTATEGTGSAAVALWTEPVSGMSFVRLPPGSFEMGSPEGEAGREAQETRHLTTLRRGFWLARTEVTQGDWLRVMGSNPSKFVDAGARAPVEQVSWHDVRRFLVRLGELAPGNRFRLPTEAEWEYACRAGTTTAYATGDRLSTDQANYDGRYPLPGQSRGVDRDRTLPVASFAPNAWGLFDLHGNVWEWTSDDYCPYPDGPMTDPVGQCDSGLKVIRGGSFYFNAASARCALRYTHRPQDRGPSLGFRPVREPASAEGEER